MMAPLLGDARGSKKHFPVGTPALLGRLDAERVKSFGQSRDGFVGRKDPSPVSNQTLSDPLKIVARQLDRLPLFCSSVRNRKCLTTSAWSLTQTLINLR
jgi:hypothetical protein